MRSRRRLLQLAAATAGAGVLGASTDAFAVAAAQVPLGGDGYLVVPILGQSNAVGAAVDSDPLVDTTDPMVFYYAGSGPARGTIIPATNGMYQPYGGQTFGFGLPFGKLLAGATGRRVLLVPLAKSGSVFESAQTYVDTWKADRTAPLAGGVQLYDAAVAGINAVMAVAGTNSTIDSVLWLQGESDGALGVPGPVYQADLLLLIDNLRTAIPALAVAPFLLGQMVPEGMAGTGRPAINAVHLDIPRLRDLTAFSYSPLNSFRSYLGAPDTTHFNAAGQREVARRLFAARGRAQVNKHGTSPVPPAVVTITVSGTTAVLTWGQAFSRVTDYVVQVAGLTSGEWVSVPRTANSLDTTASIAGVAVGTVLSARVATVNESGQSDWSAVATAAACAVPPPAVSQSGTTAAVVSWQPNPLASGYRVDKKKSNSATWIVGTSVAAGPVTVTGLSTAAWDFRLTIFSVFGVTSVTVSQAIGAAAPISGLSATPFRAMGLRRVLDSYSAAGPAIDVRRGGDNATATINLTGGGLDLAALAAFAGLSDVFVTRLYDQSGGGNHYTQPLPAAQPKVVSAGAIVTLNGCPAMLGDGVDDVLYSATVGAYAAGATTIAMVTQGRIVSGAAAWGESKSTDGTIYEVQGNRSDGRLSSFIRNDAGTVVQAADAVGYLPPAFTMVATQWTSIDTGSATVERVNAAQVGTRSYTRSGALTPATSAIFALQKVVASAAAALKIAEFLEFHSALSAGDLAILESNERACFQIT